jgi:anti-sigma B factor antagonist
MSSPAEDPAVYDLTIDTREDGPSRVLALRGELDVASAGALSEAVSQQCSQGAKSIVLEIAELDFVDSTGLRAILASQRLCSERDCELTLTPSPDELPGQVRRLLEITGLLGQLPFSGPAGGSG